MKRFLVHFNVYATSLRNYPVLVQNRVERGWLPIPVGDQVDYLAVNSRKGGGVRGGGAERFFYCFRAAERETLPLD
jgi:hypothetical protein